MQSTIKQRRQEIKDTNGLFARTWKQAKFLLLASVFGLHRSIHLLLSPSRVSFPLLHDFDSPQDIREAFQKHKAFKYRMQLYSLGGIIVIVAGAVVFTVVQLIFPLQNTSQAFAGGTPVPGVTYTIPEPVEEEQPAVTADGEVTATGEEAAGESAATESETTKTEAEPDGETSAADGEATATVKERKPPIDLEVTTRTLSPTGEVRTQATRVDLDDITQKIALQESIEEQQKFRTTLQNSLMVSEIDLPAITPRTAEELQTFEGVELNGEAFPQSNVHVDYCSSQYLRAATVQADENGKWNAEVIVPEALGSGKHTMLVASSADGIETEGEVVAEFLNEEESQYSGTFFLILTNLLLIWIVSLVVLDLNWKNRPKALKKIGAKSKFWQLIASGTLLAGLTALIVYNIFGYRESAAVDFTGLVDLPEVSIQSVEGQEVEAGQTVRVDAKDTITIYGKGAPQASGSLAVCEGIEYYAADINAAGTWTVDIPLNEIPSNDAVYKMAVVKNGEEIVPLQDIAHIQVDDRNLGLANWIIAGLLFLFILVSDKFEWEMLKYEEEKYARPELETYRAPKSTTPKITEGKISVSEQDKEAARQAALKRIAEYRKMVGEEDEDAGGDGGPHSALEV